MSTKVCAGAMLKCSCGVAPSVLNVIPHGVLTEDKPAATIMDNALLVNIPPFGLCNSPANPAVAAAIVASGGTVTQAPCAFVPASPWMPGAVKTLIGGVPALTGSCKLMCIFAGAIEIEMPGQVSVETS